MVSIALESVLERTVPRAATVDQPQSESSFASDLIDVEKIDENVIRAMTARGESFAEESLRGLRFGLPRGTLALKGC